MNRFVTGFLTGLLSGLGVAAVAIQARWRHPPLHRRLRHCPSLPMSVLKRMSRHLSPNRLRSPPRRHRKPRAVVPVPVHELLVDVLRAPDKEGNRFPNPLRPLHERLEREEKDPVWAPYMEGHLREYIGRQPGVQAQRIEVPIVECRATLCEIQAHADVEDRSREADWQRIAAKMHLEPWWDEFVDMVSSVHPKNTRATHVTFLLRKSPPTR